MGPNDKANPPVKQPGTPQPQKNRVLLQQQSFQQIQISAFPPEEMVVAYEKLCPGATDRLIAYTEGNQKHRHEMETNFLTNDHSIRSRGQWMAFVLALIVIVGGLLLIWNGSPASGFVLLVPAMSGIIGLFIYAERSKKAAQKEAQKPS